MLNEIPNHKHQTGKISNRLEFGILSLKHQSGIHHSLIVNINFLLSPYRNHRNIVKLGRIIDVIEQL
jgi:hypothetical protein